MALSVGKVTAQLELQDNFTTRLAAASTGLAKFAKQASGIGDSLQSIGTKATLGLTLPIAGAVLTATKSFTTFETAMKKAQAAMADGSKSASDVAAEMVILKNAAIEWGQKTSFSAAEAGEALAELGKAGFKATEAAGALPSVLQLAEASSIGLADAASITANTMTTFGHSITDLARDNDILTKTVNSATIDIGDLRESLKYVGPIARTAGISLEEVAAATAMLSGAGIKGSMAGTTLRNTLTELMGPSKKTTEYMQALGIASFTSNGQVMGMADVLDLLAEKLPQLGGKAEQTAALIAMFGDRAGPGMAALLETGSGALRKMEEELRNSEGTAKRAADIMMSGLGGALERMSGAMDTAATAVGEALVPAIAWGAAILENLANFLTSTLVPAFLALPGPVQATAFALLAIVAAAGPVLVGLGTMAKLIPFLSGGLTLLNGLLAGTAAGVVMVDGALMVAVGTLNLVIPGWTLWAGAILGVAAAIITWLGGWGPMWTALKAAASWLYDRLVPAFDAFGVVVTAVATPLVWFVGRLQALGGAIVDLVGRGLQPSIEAWQAFGTRVLEVIGVIGDLLAIAYHLGAVLGSEIRAKVAEVVEWFQKWWNAASLLGQIVKQAVIHNLTVMRDRLAAITGPLSTVWNLMQQWGASMKGAVAGAITSVITTLRELMPPFDWLLSKLAWMKNNVPSWDGFRKGVKDLRESFTTVLPPVAAANTAFATFGENAYKTTVPVLGLGEAAKKTAGGIVTLGGETKKANDWLGQFKEGLTELSAKISLAAANGTPLVDMVREFGDEALDSATKAKMFGVAVSDSLAQVAKATSDAAKMGSGGALSMYKDLRTDIGAWTKSFEEAVATQEKLTADTLQARTQGYENNARGIAQINDELFEAIEAREVDSLAQRLAFVERDIQKRRAALDKNGANYGAALQKIEQLEREAIASTTLAWMMKGDATKAQLGEMAVEAANRYDAIRNSGVATAESIAAAFNEMRDAQIAAADAAGFSWTTMLGSVADGMSRLGATMTAMSGGEGKMGAAGRVLSQGGGLAGTLQDQMKRYGEGNRVGIASPLFDPKATKGAKIGAGIGSGVAVAQGAMSVWAATGNSKSRGGAALSGAMAGAQAGAAFGPYGMMIGAAAGLIVGLVRGKAAWAKAQTEIARDYKGLKAISDETAKAIQENTKKLFKGDRATGNLFALDQIIGEGGGLNAANFDGLIGKLGDVFGAIAAGKFTTAQGLEVLNKNWKTFADVAVASGKIASAQFMAVGEQADKAGMKIEGRAEHLKEMLGRFGSAIARMMAPLKNDAATALDTLAKANADADKLRFGAPGGNEKNQTYGNTDLLGSEDKAALAMADSRGDHARAKILALQGDFERFGSLTIAGIAAARKQGLGYLETFDSMGDALSTLIPMQEQYDRMGVVAGSAALKQLIAEKQLIDANRDKVDAALAYNDALVSGSFLGILNAETLDTFAQQGMASFESLTAAGFSQKSALEMLKGGIEAARDRYVQLGIPMDGNTQKLYDMATAEGVFGTKAASTNDLLIDGLGALITAVGGELPESFKKAAAAAQTAATDAARGAQIATEAVTAAANEQQSKIAGLSEEALLNMTSLTPELITQISAMGPEYAALMATMGTDTEGFMTKFAGAAKDAGGEFKQALTDEAKEQLYQLAIKADAAWQEIESGIGGVISKTDDWASKLSRLPGRIEIGVDFVGGTPPTGDAPPADERDENGNPIYRAAGGIVPNWRPRGSDVVPAMLTPGEGVVNTRGMATIGAAGLDALNRGGAVTQQESGGAGGRGDVEFRLTDRGGEKLAEMVIVKAPKVLRNIGATRR